MTPPNSPAIKARSFAPPAIKLHVLSSKGRKVKEVIPDGFTGSPLNHRRHSHLSAFPLNVPSNCALI